MVSKDKQIAHGSNVDLFSKANEVEPHHYLRYLFERRRWLKRANIINPCFRTTETKCLVRFIERLLWNEWDKEKSEKAIEQAVESLRKQQK